MLVKVKALLRCIGLLYIPTVFLVFRLVSIPGDLGVMLPRRPQGRKQPGMTSSQVYDLIALPICMSRILTHMP